MGRPFFIYFCFDAFSILVASRIRTWIVGVDGKEADRHDGLIIISYELLKF